MSNAGRLHIDGNLTTKFSTEDIIQNLLLSSYMLQHTTRSTCTICDCTNMDFDLIPRLAILKSREFASISINIRLLSVV